MPITEWEYKIESLPYGTNYIFELLNKLGNERWELVTIARQPKDKPTARDADLDYLAYFKRPKQ